MIKACLANKKRLIISVIVLLLVIVFVLLIGEYRSKTVLVGNWERIEGPIFKGYSFRDMALLKDGSGIVEGQGITWKIEEGHLYIIHSTRAFSFGHKISGSTLILINNKAEQIAYEKID